MNRPGQIWVPEGAAPARFTAAEFLRMADLGAFADMKVELVDGEIVRTNPPYTAHAAGQANVMLSLAGAVSDPRFTVLGEVGIQLGENSVRAFDTCVVKRDALGDNILRPQHVLIGVEVADTTIDVDLGRKLRDYAEAGIPHYWVVDVNARVIHVMREPEGGGFSSRGLVRYGEPLELPQGPGSITLD